MPFSTTPAYDRLLTADRDYHAVFLVVGGFFTALLILLCAFAWRRFRRTRRRVDLSFAAASLALILFLAVALWANVTSVVDPRRTLAGTPCSPLGEAWLRTGRPQLTPALQRAIDDRVSWQAPKAVICAVLLVAFVTLTAYLWRSILRRRATVALTTATTLSAAVSVLL